MAGPRLEPLIHPKPGAVTRIHAHPDKDIVDFMLAVTPLEAAAHATCIEAYTRCKGSIAVGLSLYKSLYRMMGIKTNINIGTLILVLPLAASHGLTGSRDPGRLASTASIIVRECTGEEEAKLYYDLLKSTSPSHLGVYKGPLPSVGEEPKGYGFKDIIEYTSWDLVHSELANGYRASLQALEVLKKSPGSLEDKALHALLYILSEYGDTLVARKYGFRAYKVLRIEARIARTLATRVGVRRAVEELDRLWRPRGWSPGSALDILATVIGFYILSLIEG